MRNGRWKETTDDYAQAVILGDGTDHAWEEDFDGDDDTQENVIFLAMLPRVRILKDEEPLDKAQEWFEFVLAHTEA